MNCRRWGDQGLLDHGRGAGIWHRRPPFVRRRIPCMISCGWGGPRFGVRDRSRVWNRWVVQRPSRGFPHFTVSPPCPTQVVAQRWLGSRDEKEAVSRANLLLIRYLYNSNTTTPQYPCTKCHLPMPGVLHHHQTCTSVHLLDVLLQSTIRALTTPGIWTFQKKLLPFCRDISKWILTSNDRMA